MSFGVSDTGVFVSTSIALSEALEDRGLGAGTRVSGLGVRLSLGPWWTGVSGPFEVDGVALAASTEGAEGVAAGPLWVATADS